ncbi:MAG: hypothetical protein ACE5H1_10230, partial [Thermodesulfobacteriota bacterium]
DMSRLVLIDHGYTFPSQKIPERFSSIFYDIVKGNYLLPEHTQILEGLLLDEENIRNIMRTFLSPDELDGLFDRASEMLQYDEYYIEAR